MKQAVWDKPDTVDLSIEQPVYSLDAKTVIDLIQNKSNNDIEVDQVIEVEGIVKKISYLNNRTTILLGAKETDNTFIICDMEPNQSENVSKVSTNDTIKLKGVFKGALEDAIFFNCIISE